MQDKSIGMRIFFKLLGKCLATVVCLHASQIVFADDHNIVNLQPFRSDTILDISSTDKARAGFVRLVNLNINLNSWYLLDVTWPGEEKSKIFHLENPEPSHRLIFLDKAYPEGLRIVDKTGEYKCPLWAENKESELIAPDNLKKTYAPICEARVFIRNETEGQESTKEWVADLLRSHVWGGEQITTLVKDYLYKDKFLLTASEHTTTATDAAKDSKNSKVRRPSFARVAPDKSNVVLEAKEMGISLRDAKSTEMLAGKWYEIEARRNVYMSIMRGSLIADQVLDANKSRVLKMDAVESEALAYLIAFDLKYYQLGFALGTKHPSPEWSERTPEKTRKADMAGPDGIGSLLPLKMTGKVGPQFTNRVISTFTGGFKRSHGAFKWGRLSQVNHASHYGFMENGVILSKLQPELATLLIFKDGETQMKTWTNEDNALLPKIMHARQNGVPIIEYDPEKKMGVPGALVNNWMQGNWSGSIDSKQRALRAGACIQEHDGQRYLIYAYFSSVTPNTMARIFESYQCQYAFHLDMNALEHTYLAIYQSQKNKFKIEHLITGMNVLDKKTNDQSVPRFVGTADNRDFFYVMEKN